MMFSTKKIVFKIVCLNEKIGSKEKMFKSIDIGEGKRLKNKKTQYSISMVR